jgi:glutathione peroxidase
MSIYQFDVQNAKGETVSLANYKNKILLIVNTASQCGYTRQYKELQELHNKYSSEDFVVLGFPCNQFGNQEPGSNEEIQSFCQLNFGVTFPVFAKVNVNGNDASPLFKYLTTEARGILGTKDVKWNFTKFLVNRQGEVVKRYASATNPLSIQEDISELLHVKK